MYTADQIQLMYEKVEMDAENIKLGDRSIEIDGKGRIHTLFESKCRLSRFKIMTVISRELLINSGHNQVAEERD